MKEYVEKGFAEEVPYEMLRIELHTTCRIMLCFVMTKRQLSAESCLMHPCEEMMVFSLTIESFPELT